MMYTYIYIYDIYICIQPPCWQVCSHLLVSSCPWIPAGRVGQSLYHEGRAREWYGPSFRHEPFQNEEVQSASVITMSQRKDLILSCVVIFYICDMSKDTMKYNEICSHPNIRSSVVFAPILRVSFCCTHLLNRLHSVRKSVNVGTCLNLRHVRNVRNLRLKRAGGTGSRTKPSWGNAIRSRGPDQIPAGWCCREGWMWNDCDSCCQTFLWPLKCKRFKCFSMTWRIYYIE